MTIIDQTQPDLFRYVTDSNLSRQYDLLKTMVQIALTKPEYRVSHDLIQQLNAYAVLFLCQTAGSYRTDQVYIRDTKHIPPPGHTVPSHMDDLIKYLDDNWNTKESIHLAAYALWRLCWVHPFKEGNGRAARATAYFVLYVKSGMWLPGTNTIPKLIRENRPPCIIALGHADDHWSQNRLDLSDLEAYLTALLTKQLS